MTRRILSGSDPTNVSSTLRLKNPWKISSDSTSPYEVMRSNSQSPFGNLSVELKRWNLVFQWIHLSLCAQGSLRKFQGNLSSVTTGRKTRVTSPLPQSRGRASHVCEDKRQALR
uniref:Uncharacterized protein n=1 Tax=Cacopsylla melanoneura TaxID=428564 RepID=A0A8D8WVG2_9HEMI